MDDITEAISVFNLLSMAPNENVEAKVKAQTHRLTELFLVMLYQHLLSLSICAFRIAKDQDTVSVKLVHIMNNPSVTGRSG